MLKKENPMVRRSSAAVLACCLASMAVAITGWMASESSAAGAKSSSKRPIRNPKFDPSGEQVNFFEAMESGQIETRLIPKNALGGNVLIENKTDKPLNVKMPEVAVGVPFHAQFGGGGGFGGQQGGFGGQQGGFGGGGGQQQQGGGFGGQQGGFGGQQGGGQGGFFGGGGGFGGVGMTQQVTYSVPPERTISVPFTSVCLEHGKPEPTPSSRYKLVPLETVSSDPVLYELLSVVGTGKVDSQSAQAAAWHLTDKMTFDQLAAEKITHLGGQAPTPYFTQAQLQGARQLLALSTKRMEERKEKSTSESSQTSQTSSTSTSRTTATK